LLPSKKVTLKRAGYDGTRMHARHVAIRLKQFAIVCAGKWRDLEYDTWGASDLSIDQ